MDAERQATHSAECWRWHLGCAVARAERLERELAILCDEDQRKLLEVERLRAALSEIGRLADRDDPNSSGALVLRGIRQWVSAALAPGAGEGDDGDR